MHQIATSFKFLDSHPVTGIWVQMCVVELLHASFGVLCFGVGMVLSGVGAQLM